MLIGSAVTRLIGRRRPQPSPSASAPPLCYLATTAVVVVGLVGVVVGVVDDAPRRLLEAFEALLPSTTRPARSFMRPLAPITDTIRALFPLVCFVRKGYSQSSTFHTQSFGYSRLDQ